MILFATIVAIISLVLTIATVVLSILLRPKSIPPRPKMLDELSIPTADEDRPIPVIFGKVLVKDSNITWYGDLDQEPVYYSGDK